MKQQLVRDQFGKIQGKLDSYWFHNEDESYQDIKVTGDLLFPSHKGNLNGECITYSIKDLKTN